MIKALLIIAFALFAFHYPWWFAVLIFGMLCMFIGTAIGVSHMVNKEKECKRPHLTEAEKSIIDRAVLEHQWKRRLEVARQQRKES